MSSIEEAIECMARAAVDDSFPATIISNPEKLAAIKAEQLPEYKKIAVVMLRALLQRVTYE